MKSVGEVMGIGRCFEEAFQKALRMVNDHYSGFTPTFIHRQTVEEDFTKPTDKRMLLIAHAMQAEQRTVEQLYEWTKIDRWFLYRMQNIIDIWNSLVNQKFSDVSLIWEAKRAGFSDQAIAEATQTGKGNPKQFRKEHKIWPCVKQIDTVAGEWPAATNYLYLSYSGRENDVEPEEMSQNSDTKNVMVLGSGVYRIGSSVEFDACCVGCVKQLRQMGHKTIMVNCNPETVSTDYDICDRLYFEEISIEVAFAVR